VVAATPATPAGSSRAPVTEVLAMPPPGASATAAAGEGDVVLRFRGDSWVEVLGADGATIERGLVAAGTERRFAPGQIRQLTLGDAAAVDVSQGGATVAPGPGGAAKVARFTVSSDGSIHPSAID
jgi:cytoskeleton protein RodZ